MGTNLFRDALKKQNRSRPPVWFMRQAGRYHSHYQAIKKNHSFMEICKNPEIAAQATLGPIEDFGFDAAILFSDLLFPLEVMGMGLSYPNAGPELAWKLKDKKDLSRLQGGASLAEKLNFQADAMRLIRERLNPDKGLLGFVGGPLTLFYYAVEGSHKGNLDDAKRGLRDGRYGGFVDCLKDLLAENIALQMRAGADAVMIIDTCAGELAPEEFNDYVVPILSQVFNAVRTRTPGAPLAYYSKGTTREHWRKLFPLDLQYLGVDWNSPISEVLKEFGDRWAIQGNFDPNLLLLPTQELEPKLKKFFSDALTVPAPLRCGWICGLGHGILPGTPEAHVRLFLKYQKELFG